MIFISFFFLYGINVLATRERASVGKSVKLKKRLLQICEWIAFPRKEWERKKQMHSAEHLKVAGTMG